MMPSEKNHTTRLKENKYMYRKWLTLSLAAALLSACAEDAPKKTGTLQCDDPTLTQSVRTTVQDTIKREARSFARSDSRQFVDADKVIAAASELDISLEGMKEVREGNKTFCRADVLIQIPSDIADAADANSPLIYGDTGVRELIEQKIMGSQTTLSGNRFALPLRYTPTAEGIRFEDNALTTTAQTLSAALLPYGVKSIVLIDGKPVSREDAVKMSRNSAHSEPPEADPEDILENNAASQTEGVPQDLIGMETTTEMLNPDTTRDNVSLAQSDLENARTANRQAEAEITSVWNGMERGVQQGILDEQREWIQRKQQNCTQAAAAADSPAQAEYLQLQCDTRMTRERTQYLRGFTIN